MIECTIEQYRKRKTRWTLNYMGLPPFYKKLHKKQKLKYSSSTAWSTFSWIFLGSRQFRVKKNANQAINDRDTQCQWLSVNESANLIKNDFKKGMYLFCYTDLNKFFFIRLFHFDFCVLYNTIYEKKVRSLVIWIIRRYMK